MKIVTFNIIIVFKNIHRVRKTQMHSHWLEEDGDHEEDFPQLKLATTIFDN